MGEKILSRIKKSIIQGDYAGRDINTVNIVMPSDCEREFIVTNNACIKPVAYFTGRETELQDLRQMIEEGRKSVLVSGMGGIGKTNICMKLFEEYIKKHAEGENGLFSHIGYIEYSGDMESSLQKCLKFEKQDDPKQNKEAAWHKLEKLASNGQLLLFVDNVNVSMSQDSGLKRLLSIPGPVVLTSRRRTFSKEFEPYQIGFLSTEKCREIYEKIYYVDGKKKIAEEEAADLEYIIDVLVLRHTITIELLAKLARIKRWTAQRLRDELERNKFKLENVDDELVNIQESYEKLYDLSELTEAERNILEAFSVFPYIPLAAETCNKWLIVDAGVSENDDILMGLYEKGWLQFYEDQESYALHPVFAQFIYEKCKPNEDNHTGLIETCLQDLKNIESESFLECQKLMPFAESIIEKMDMKKSVKQVQFIKIYAWLLKCSGKFKEAERYFKKALKIYRDVIKEDSCETADIYYGLAEIYIIWYEYGKAQELYEKSLEIRKKMLGENHNDTAASYCSMAFLYECQQEYGKAKELYEKCLKIYERVPEENQAEIASIYNNLGGIYRAQRNYRKAEEFHEKSLGIRERVFGENHLHTAISYRNLAGIYLNTWRYREAKKLYEKSLLIYESVIGKNHPDTALTYNDLGVTYYTMGRYREAVDYSFRAYRIDLDILGPDNPHTQLFLFNLRNAYFKSRIVIFNRDAKFRQWVEERINE